VVSVCVLPPPNWVMSVSTGAVFSVSTGQPPQHHARVLAQRPVKQVRAKNCAGRGSPPAPFRPPPARGAMANSSGLNERPSRTSLRHRV
jgi:hypothetical protein